LNASADEGSRRKEIKHMRNFEGCIILSSVSKNAVKKVKAKKYTLSL